MQNEKLKIWSCIALLVVFTVTGFQGDNRLDSWTIVEAAAQPPQECKDAAGATIPCPPTDDGDRGRTDCEDTDRDGVCDSQEPRECIGQLDELGNGCAADDDAPSTRARRDLFYIVETGITASYPQPSCDDEDFGSRAGYLKIGDIKGESTETPCPDSEPEFDCELTGPFAFCNTFEGIDPEGATEDCAVIGGGQVCCTTGVCACIGQTACKALSALCSVVGGTYEGLAPGNVGQCGL